MRFRLLLFAALLMFIPGIASARESRELDNGVTLTVGFSEEPAIQGDTNGLWLRVMNGDTPVEGLESVLQNEVVFQEQTRILPMVPVDGEPGVYTSPFIPMQTGPYTFRIRGTIEGVAVDESFTSSQGGVAEVMPRTEYEFPTSAHGMIGTLSMPLAATIVTFGAIWIGRHHRNSTRPLL